MQSGAQKSSDSDWPFEYTDLPVSCGTVEVRGRNTVCPGVNLATFVLRRHDGEADVGCDRVGSLREQGPHNACHEFVVRLVCTKPDDLQMLGIMVDKPREISYVKAPAGLEIRFLRPPLSASAVSTLSPAWKDDEDYDAVVLRRDLRELSGVDCLGMINVYVSKVTGVRISGLERLFECLKRTFSRVSQ